MDYCHSHRKLRLEVNISKTEYICVGGILKDKQKIKSFQTFKYLVTKISNIKILDEAIRDRSTQGRKAIIAMWNGVLSDSKITKRNKYLIYNTAIKTIVTYSSEIGKLKEKTTLILKKLK